MSPQPHILLLAGLAALGSFAIDTYLPSFHEIGTQLKASPLAVQQTLSFYLIPFAIMALWHGALADALGRRRVMLYALGLFLLSALGCALATHIEHLWLLRALQGASAGAGIIISRTVVRDLHAGAAAQKTLSKIALLAALAPAIAPVIGAWLQHHGGWRSIFVFLALLALTLYLACLRGLPETLPAAQRRPLHPAYLIRSYRNIFSHPAFLTSTLALACNFNGFFIYVVSSPQFVVQHLQLSEQGFLWLFAPIVCGVICGSGLSARLAQHRSDTFCITQGYVFMLGAAVLNLSICYTLPPSLPWNILPLLIYTLGMALAMPSLILRGIEPFAEQRGLAASCQTALQSLCHAFCAGIVAPFLWASLQKLALGMTGILLLGICASRLHLRLTLNAR